MGASLRIVFSRAQYCSLAVVVAGVVFTLALWLPNISLIFSYLESGATLSEKIHFILNFYGTVMTSHTAYSAGVAFVLALLSGINVALLTFYTRRVSIGTPGLKRTYAGSYFGLLIGFLGVGCAACGSVILTALLTLLGVGGILAFFPFAGAEVGVFAVLLLIASNYYLLKKIEQPIVCAV